MLIRRALVFFIGLEVILLLHLANSDVFRLSFQEQCKALCLIISAQFVAQPIKHLHQADFLFGSITFRGCLDLDPLLNVNDESKVVVIRVEQLYECFYQ